MFILEIQQIIESHHLKGYPIFHHACPITTNIFNMCSMQKISQIHSWIWKLEFHEHFLPQPPEIIKVDLNFVEFTSVCQKSAQFIHSFIHSLDQCLGTLSMNFFYELLL